MFKAKKGARLARKKGAALLEARKATSARSALRLVIDLRMARSCNSSDRQAEKKIGVSRGGTEDKLSNQKIKKKLQTRAQLAAHLGVDPLLQRGMHFPLLAALLAVRIREHVRSLAPANDRRVAIKRTIESKRQNSNNNNSNNTRQQH